jgi:hypothetical protein
MIPHFVEQGSPMWNALRLGIPTASMFHKICTAKTGKYSTAQTCRAYAHFIITEKLLGQSLNPLENLEWIQRGKDMEPQAVKMYEFEMDVETKPVGFITTDDGRWGCSPDRLLIGVNGALEIKCPAPHTHVGCIVDGFGEDYKVQVQGQMLIGDFEFIDRYSFCPDLPVPTYNFRTYRDEPYIALLRSALDQFCEMRDEMLEKLRAAGWDGKTPAPVEVRDALDREIDEADRREPLNDFGPSGVIYSTNEQFVTSRGLEGSPDILHMSPPDDWQLVADKIRNDIDQAKTTPYLALTIDSREFIDLERARPQTGAFLRDRALKRAAALMQASKDYRDG